MTIFKDIKLFMLDMDGTIYLGNRLIDGAKEFLEKVQKSGKEYIFLTNNSSKNRQNYREKLQNLGIEASLDQIFTSGEATTIYLKKQAKGKRIFLLGTESLENQFIEESFQLVTERDQEVDYVVLGFDTTLNYEKIWAACDYIRQGVPFIATHPDLNCPLENDRFMPDAGAMIRLFEASTGVSPKIIGKPEKPMIEAVLRKYGYQNHEVAMVGDRLYTDIKMGIEGDITSVLVFSGETKLEDYKRSDINATYVFDSVKQMQEHL